MNAHARSKGSTARYGYTSLSHLSKAQRKRRRGLSGRTKADLFRHRDQMPKFNKFAHDGSDVPEAFDWSTDSAVVNPVKDQGECGSCWAFTTVSVLESHWARSGNGLLDLSEIICRQF